MNSEKLNFCTPKCNYHLTKLIINNYLLNLSNYYMLLFHPLLKFLTLYEYKQMKYFEYHISIHSNIHY